MKAKILVPRFAAKEAAVKAHPWRNLTFHSILIERSTSEPTSDRIPKGTGPPVAIIRGNDQKTPDQKALISISHDGEYATAVCLGFEPNAAPVRGT